MHRRTLFRGAAAALALPLLNACAVPGVGGTPVPAIASNTVVQGVTTSADGRVFLVLARLDGSDGPRVVEWVNGEQRAYPDAAWNGWRPGASASNSFVRANSLRIGPEGDLWVLDVGAPGIGNPKLPGGPKLVQIDLKTNAARRIYRLDELTGETSFIDDLRFNDRRVYVTDAGKPGLIVLDLDRGTGYRALDGHPSMTAQRPLTAEGQELRGPDGKPVFVHADQLEVSPDGQWLYYQSASGPMSRIATRWIEERALTDAVRGRYVEPWVETGSTGGTAIDADGNLYVSDTDKQRVVRIAPDRTSTVITEDPRLLWVDAMWIDDAGALWMPAAQLNRMAPFNGGTSRVQFPVQVYKLALGVKPVRR
ncbi:L-dopachrome tautomerase-related protein [Roseomonas elaeocarpi]|uniref:L-dopachrome tautomerase-related protein n=1 Tax=Roseomonas elaeocarpi TaxID=907779 RepID=A0ABV6JTZ9_9PROT